MNLLVNFLVPVFSAVIDKLPSAVTETGPLLPKKMIHVLKFVRC